jgi:hypothetical protein
MVDHIEVAAKAIVAVGTIQIDAKLKAEIAAKVAAIIAVRSSSIGNL